MAFTAVQQGGLPICLRSAQGAGLPPGRSAGMTGYSKAFWHASCSRRIFVDIARSIPPASHTAARRLAHAASRALPPGVVVVALTVVALNLLDAFLTLAHIQLGATELNPLVRQFLEQREVTFVVGKHLLVGTGVLFLVTHARRCLVLSALRFLILPAYATVAVYQVALFALDP